MFRRSFFYFSIAAICIAAVVLVLAARGAFIKKPAKPTIAAVQMPPEAKEAPLPLVAAPVPAPTAVEEKASTSAVELPPKVEETAPIVPVPVATEAQVPPAEKERAVKYEFQKGMTYAAWTGNGYSTINSPKAMEQMASLGINYVAILANWYQDKYNSTKIYPEADKSPSDESIIFAIRKFHELKFKVMLKPHLDFIASDGKWRGDIGCTLVEDWQAWFDSYANYILHYAKLAEQENVELFCIGTELVNSTYCKPELWRDLIKKIREVYKGQLTYAANWNKEFQQISFWDALDYAGIDPYFPLVTSARPKVEELKSAWGDWIKEIEEWQQKINKPVIFTEISYKSSRDAADEPWQHTPIGELDLGLQVNLYKALLESFWDKPWFYGVYWWYWGTNTRMGGESNRGFTPQNKPAQEVIKEWYSKPISQKEY